MAVRDDYSVGGVALDDDGRVALVLTRTLKGELVWTLPKGHPEPGEDPVDAAVREVREETGLDVVAEEGPIASDDYWFVDRDGARVHKRVDFYRMRIVGGDPTGHDHEVEKVELVPCDEAKERVAYPSLRKVLEVACG